MVSLLHAYLLDNRILYLPGAGRMQLVRQPAVYDVANQLLQPPHTIITLTAEDGGTNPASLAAFLSSRLNIETGKAAALFSQFCKYLTAELEKNGNFHWHHLGSFVRQNEGNVVFRPGEQLESFNKPVPAVRIVRPGSVHNMVVGNSETTSTQMQEYLTEQAVVKLTDRWWIAALAIGIVAIVLILLRKMQYL